MRGEKKIEKEREREREREGGQEGGREEEKGGGETKEGGGMCLRLWTAPPITCTQVNAYQRLGVVQ